jgi:hypothetical protein
LNWFRDNRSFRPGLIGLLPILVVLVVLRIRERLGLRRCRWQRRQRGTWAESVDARFLADEQAIMNLAAHRGVQASPHRRLGVTPDVGEKLALDGESSNVAEMERLLRRSEDLDRGFEKGHEVSAEREKEGRPSPGVKRGGEALDVAGRRASFR